MKRNATLGFRAHSGWAAVVACNPDEVIERGKILMVDGSRQGVQQPYHWVEKWALELAKKHLDECLKATRQLTRTAVGDILKRLEGCGYQVRQCALLAGSGRALGSLESILASHAMIHTAEGEFFRDAIRDAAGHHKLKLISVREKGLLAESSARLGLSEVELQQKLAKLGKTSGPPWRIDEKFATVAAWLAG